ncbi:MAG: 3-isopropylmalate dehydratase [Actinobacteria bacterium]|nr:3-isopropylmalate dehydratase [Actinomycetota bacterium]
MIIAGRAHVFGDDIDTDLMMPGKALRAPVAEVRGMLFDAVRPGFHETVAEGDVIVGGQRFGTGSARPVAMHLRAMGVRAIVAESMSSLFQRNSINAGVLAVVAPGIAAAVTDGAHVEIDALAGEIRIAGRAEALRFSPLPDLAMQIVVAGGVIDQLVAAGYLPRA